MQMSALLFYCQKRIAGKLPAARALALVLGGRGATGSNVDYLRNTVAHLRDLGLRDRALEELARRSETSGGARRR